MSTKTKRRPRTPTMPDSPFDFALDTMLDAGEAMIASAQIIRAQYKAATALVKVIVEASPDQSWTQDAVLDVFEQAMKRVERCAPKPPT